MEGLDKIFQTPQDAVLPFQLEALPIRGRLVRLGAVLDVILGQHAYPPAVARLLGEAMCVAVALGTSLKYDGVFTLQVKSDGPVRMLVADVTSDGGVRAYAQADAERLSEGVPLLGSGYLVFTVDQSAKEDRYQGIVQLQGDSLAEAVQHYFRQSEQIPTTLLSAMRQDGEGHWHGGCLMLQRLPREGGFVTPVVASEEDDWQRALALMQTCTPEELTDPVLSSATLLYRLFHEDGVRAFDPLPLRHQCRCSQERVATMLRSLPREELAELAVKGEVSVTCEFCNRTYGLKLTDLDAS